MNHYVTRSLVTLAGLLTSGFVYAVNPSTPPTTIPEPSMLGLLAIGGVVGAIVAVRKRRK